MEDFAKRKTRAWTFELYEDSCNPNWEEIMIESHVQFAYAYHDKDLLPNGEAKKPHYHVMEYFEGPQTYKVALELANRVGCANGVIQPVSSVRGMIRYFTHKDSPDKYQYNDSIVQVRNGFDIDNFIELTATQKKEYKKVIQTIIKEREILEYSELMDYLLYDEDIDYLYDVASTNTYYFKAYIDSKRHRLKDKEKLRKEIEQEEKMLTLN